jgi:hypothetical protein
MMRSAILVAGMAAGTVALTAAVAGPALAQAPAAGTVSTVHVNHGYLTPDDGLEIGG